MPESATDRRPQPSPECPRCGYDLSGETERWQDRCPLEGVCSECGLTFAWRDVLVERFRRHDDLFEHARRRPCRAFGRTLIRCWRPPRLWRLIGMQMAPVWHRLVVFAAVGVVCSTALLVVAPLALPVTGIHLLGNRGWITHDPLMIKSVAITVSRDLDWVRTGLWDLGSRGSWLSNADRLRIGLAAALIAPWTLLLVPATLPKARQRQWHVVRIAAYAFVAWPIALLMWVACRSVADLMMVVSIGWDKLPWTPARVRWAAPRWHHEADWIHLMGDRFGWAWAWIWAYVTVAWAASGYLRLKRPWGVALMLGTVALLFASLFVTPGFWADLWR